VDDNVERAVDILFPDRKSDPLPPSLPLEQYAGRYHHPGYQNLTLELDEASKDGNATSLRADRTDFTWQIIADFKHVSGEYWIMYSRLAKAPGARVFLDTSAVEFKLGVDGRVSKVGIEYGDTLSGVVDGVIWYDRVD